ncbi:MAG: Type 1 glutamine amidotransferase-like domain-containing protein, partial [Planctomycetota bacterium]
LNGLTAVKILWIDAAKSLDEKFKPIMSQLIEKANQGVADGGLLVLSGSIVESAGSLQTSGFLNFVKTKVGFGLYPDCLIRSNYDDARDRKSILSTLAAFPRAVGIGIESDSAILLNRRKIRVLGDGQATFLLMANTQKPIRIQQVRQAKLMRNNPYETTIDLTAWRRDAMDRTLPAFPPSKPPSPYVEKGTLIIVGGGGMPRGLMNQMVEMAGGSEARMVYVPCSEADEVSSQQRIVKSWIDMGVKSATFIHTKDRNKANSDDEFLEPLKNATGIWFGGGRQWNFADSYYGTQAHQLMKQVLQRGGVIGGSSAGASVQARYMCRANPVANFDIMAPGYERGLGFIGGVAIDQHFSQRRRQKDMTQLVNRYPQLLGIGIDEATAIIVRQSKADVIGRGKVHFYDRNRPVIPGEDDFIALQAGQSFDLAKRAILEESTGEKE